MTFKDLFRIIIRLFCIYSIIKICTTTLPAVVQQVLDSKGLTDPYIYSSIIIVTLRLGLFILILIKTDTVINLLRLDKGYDAETIQIGNFNAMRIASLVIILIGGFMIVDYIPRFLRYSIPIVENIIGANFIDNTRYGGSRVDYYRWGTATFNIIIGYILIKKHHTLSKKIDTMTKAHY